MSERITVQELAGSRGLRIIDIRKAPDDRQIRGAERYDGEALAAHPPFEPHERVVLYCGSGNSCSRIADDLRARGYDTIALAGGYAAWQTAGYDTAPIREQHTT